MTLLGTKPDARPTSAQVGKSAQKLRLRLAWLTTEYPKVSHTFVRREIRELERRGHDVLRLSIRSPGDAIADKADVDEASRTSHCLDLPISSLIWITLGMIVTHPWRWFSAMVRTLRMSRVSDRGLMRHLAYLVEAGWLFDVLRRHRIQHLHVHFGTNAATVALLCRVLGGPPFSITIHGPDEFDSPRGFALREKVEAAAFVIAISDFCSAQIRRWADPGHWSKIHVVHCVIDQSFLSQARPIEPECNTLLCVGRLNAQKGQLLLIDAIKSLVDEGEDVQLVLAGDGEMRSIIERQIQQLGLRAHVTITGWIDEETVRRHIRECRALVLSSFAEGLPMVLMEAMAMARPVIATSIAGVPELVSHDENGWLVPAGNSMALVKALREGLHNPADVLNDMGLAGQQRVRAQHLADVEIAKLEAILLNHISPESDE